MDIGVAVSDSPAGPFRDAIGSPLIHNSASTDDIDPTVFVDDDGRLSLLGASAAVLCEAQPGHDLFSGSIVELPRPNLYEEGPWFYRRNGHYYLAPSYCCPEGIGYAMSDSPTGPWTTKGYVMEPNAASSGNHPGIIDYQGSSYVFGFNYTLNDALTTVHRERRSINVSTMTYHDDGTIAEVPWWTSGGVAQIGTLNPYVQTEAETIAWAKGLKTETCSEGGMDVTNIESGDYLKVKGVDFGSGAASFDARVASAGSGGNLELRLDSQTGTLLGVCAVTSTGGAQTWTTKSCAISGASGVHDLFFVFTGGTGSLFNFNWWIFHPSASQPDAGVAADAGAVTDGGSRVDSGVDAGLDAGVDSGAGKGDGVIGAGDAGTGIDASARAGAVGALGCSAAIGDRPELLALLVLLGLWAAVSRGRRAGESGPSRPL